MSLLKPNLPKIELPGTFQFKSGYKHITDTPYTLKTNIIPSVIIDTGYIKLDMAGNMSLAKGYAWNGSSGPTIETLDTFIGSAFHDAGYQLISLGLLPLSIRHAFDDLLYQILIASGMPEFRAWYWRIGVWVAGEKYATQRENPVRSAP